MQRDPPWGRGEDGPDSIMCVLVAHVESAHSCRTHSPILERREEWRESYLRVEVIDQKWGQERDTDILGFQEALAESVRCSGPRHASTYGGRQ